MLAKWRISNTLEKGLLNVASAVGFTHNRRQGSVD